MGKMEERQGILDPVRIELEDDSGLWLFEDGTEISWFDDGTPKEMPKRNMTAIMIEVRNG